MLLLMQFCCVVEITACGISSNCSTMGQKHVAEFYMSYFGEEITSGKHMVQTANQLAQTDEKVDHKKIKQNGRLVDWNVFCSFVCLCYVNSKLTEAAIRNNSLSMVLGVWICHCTQHHFMYSGLMTLPSNCFNHLNGTVRTKKYPPETVHHHYLAEAVSKFLPESLWLNYFEIIHLMTASTTKLEEWKLLNPMCMHVGGKTRKLHPTNSRVEQTREDNTEGRNCCLWLCSTGKTSGQSFCQWQEGSKKGLRP